MVIEISLLLLPHIEGFVHHDEAHAVCEFQKFRRRRVVRSADAVDAHRLQDFELTFESAHIYSSAQAAQIMMIADASDLDLFAVQKKTFLSVEGEVANAERRLVAVNYFAALLDLRDGLVKIGILKRPERRAIDHERLRDFGDRTFTRDILRDITRHLLACGVINNRRQVYLLTALRSVAHARPNFHSG